MFRPAAKSLVIAGLLALGSSSASASCSGQFSPGYFCGIAVGGSLGVPGPVQITPSVFQPIAAGTIISNITGGSAAPAANTITSVFDVLGAVQGDILYRNATTWVPLPPGTAGQVLQSGGAAANPSWASIAGAVTSVGLSMPGIFTVSGSPVTTSGTLTAALNTQSANLFWAGPSTGAASAPTFRALVGADLPNPSSSTLGGVQSIAAQTSKWINAISTSGVPSSTQPNFSDLAGSAALSQLQSIGNNTILGNVSGGSAVPTTITATNILDILGATQGDLLYRNATVWVPLAPGTNGQVLTSGGAAANPSWTTVTGTGTVTNVASGTGLTGGPITTTGTLSFANIANHNILSNISGGSAVPIPNTMTAILDDTLGSTQGDILYRGASAWLVLPPGTNGQVLTQGASTPSWANAGNVSNVSIVGAGGVTTSGTCTITTTGTCTLTGTTKQMVGFSTGSALPANATHYMSQAIFFNTAIGGIPAPFGGTIKSIYANLNVDPGNTQTIAFTLNINGSDQGLGCTVTGNGSTSLTCNSSSPSVSVSAGNIMSIKTVLSAGAASGEFPSVTLELDNSN